MFKNVLVIQFKILTFFVICPFFFMFVTFWFYVEFSLNCRQEMRKNNQAVAKDYVILMLPIANNFALKILGELPSFNLALLLRFSFVGFVVMTRNNVKGY